MRINTKNDLIKLAEASLPKEFASTKRAFHDGAIENLGAFKYTHHNCSGWILKIVSKFNFTHYVGIAVCGLTYRVYILIKEPPWEYWEGDKSDNKLYQGDNPLVYKELRDDSKTGKPHKNEGHTCSDS